MCAKILKKCISLDKFPFIPIPIQIMYTPELNSRQRMIYVAYLAIHEFGCPATSKHMAELIGISPRRLRTNLTDMEKRGFITRKYIDGYVDVNLHIPERTNVELDRLNNIIKEMQVIEGEIDE